MLVERKEAKAAYERNIKRIKEETGCDILLHGGIIAMDTQLREYDLSWSNFNSYSEINAYLSDDQKTTVYCAKTSELFDGMAVVGINEMYDHHIHEYDICADIGECYAKGKLIYWHKESQRDNLIERVNQLEVSKKDWSDFEPIKKKLKTAPMGEWFETSETIYDNMLESVPPAFMRGSLFVSGEPLRHDSEGNMVYYVCKRENGEYFISVNTLANLR